MKTILITGSSSGFGLQTARTFLERGWTVIATMRTPRGDILPASERLRLLALDVTDAASIARAVDEAPVTISAGVATVPDNASDAERLMSAADAALYDAKRNGRDRVAGSGRNIEVVPPPALRWSPPLARGA